LAQRRGVPAETIRRAISSLPDVQSCGVEFEPDGSISTIHIVSQARRPAKQIVRDVESILLAEFGIKVDHRKVSVARVERGWEERGKGLKRARFISMGFSTSGGRGTGQVVLRRGDMEARGEASGVTAGDGSKRLMASATFRALEQLLGGEIELELLDVIRLSAGGRVATVVLANCVYMGRVKTLAGCVHLDEGDEQAAVLAALDACNRIVESIPPMEQTEYEIIPFEES
jgi:hypothetical protein